ncbi:MAG: CCA tRNA nucleotidyltransferase [Cetobacterium sp.]
MERIKLTDDIIWILKKLNSYGKGYIVGGYVRDYLLGIEPKDCDFCTDIDYEILKKIFYNCSPKEIGKAFGIIQIIYKGKTYEIAKLRKDISYTTLRNVAEIEFINDINEDLKRRDFTVNSIAFDGEKLIYSSNYSKEDIEKKVLRFVGDPEIRIEEDPLRILRGIRIAVDKNLKILKETELAIKNKKSEIKRISIERIQDEIFKMLKSHNSSKAFKLLNDIGLFRELFRETADNFNFFEIIEKLSKIDKLKKENLNIKLAIIFSETKKDLFKLKLDNKRKKSILNIIDNKNIIKKISSKYILKKYISIIGLEDFKSILLIEELKRDVSKIIKLLEDINLKKEPIFLKDLSISGKDLIELGISNGKDIKNILDKTHDFILKNPEYNEKNYLIKLIKEEKI